MDGYHYDDALLNQLGRRQRKGAPDTFDVPSLQHMLRRLRDHSGDPIAVPVFDRDLEISRAGARLITASIDLVVVEGNYLLLRRSPWEVLRPLFDVTVMLEVPEATLRERLAMRWRGYDLAPDEIHRKVEGVDLPNGRLVSAESAMADCLILTSQAS